MTNPEPTTGIKPKTSHDYTNEALRLVNLARQKDHALPGGNGFCQPTDEQRTQMLLQALVYATLTRQPQTGHVLPPSLRPAKRRTLVDGSRDIADNRSGIIVMYIGLAMMFIAVVVWVAARSFGADI